MSVIFQIYCDDHEVYGPHIRQGAGGTGLQTIDGRGSENCGPEDGPSSQWDAWLTAHEFCEQSLLRENMKPRSEIRPLGLPPTLPEIVQLRCGACHRELAATTPYYPQHNGPGDDLCILAGALIQDADRL